MRSVVGILVIAGASVAAACGGGPNPVSTVAPTATAEHLVLITIDTLRADRVGVYGYSAARTPAMDRLAGEGARFTRAFSPAPITLPAHASLLTGRYPPAHGARHNGIAMTSAMPTIATLLQSAGFRTAAFVSAFPLDRRFGLARGFEVYDDELPRGDNRQPLNERAGAETVRRAIAWLGAVPTGRVFLWVHVFEPHAPYLDAGADRPLAARYDEEIATADRAVAQLVAALGHRGTSTLVVIAADHGESFGEHGEIGHSMFVYDTTLRVPLLMAGPGISAGGVIDAPVSLVDIAPTVLAALNVSAANLDGVSLLPLVAAQPIAARVLYGESLAPLYDFGWSPLRTVREGSWKYIEAPRPELYDLARDPGEAHNLDSRDPDRSSRLLALVQRYGPAESGARPAEGEASNRLRSLGYLAGATRPAPPTGRADPKDRIELASRLAAVTSGEVRGDALIATLEAILVDDPANPQALLRLGYAELDRGRCDRAEPPLQKALASGLPSADGGLALAECRRRAGDFAGAARALESARSLEPGNPVVEANLGLLALARDDSATAIRWLESAVSRDLSLLEARFALARAYGRAGRRQEAASQAQTLLDQLAPDAPQRREVERLLKALQ